MDCGNDVLYGVGPLCLLPRRASEDGQFVVLLLLVDSHDEMDTNRYRWAMGDDVIMNEGGAAAQWEMERWGYCSVVAREMTKRSGIVNMAVVVYPSSIAYSFYVFPFRSSPSHLH